MLYIIIPPGMRFETLPKIKTTKDGINIETTDDCFVSDNENQAPISIQDTVKSFYQTHKPFAVINGLECHKRKPITPKPILPYIANKNGTCPGKVFVPVKQPQPTTQYHAAWWATNTFLSERRTTELEKKRAEQRADRRHCGDSPKAT